MRLTVCSLVFVVMTLLHFAPDVNTDKDIFQVIEGNTNDEGGRDGYKMRKRTRDYKAKHVIIV